MAKDSNSNGCGTKHLRLACWLIGLFLVAALGVSLAMARYQAGELDGITESHTASMNEHDTRIREVETTGAAVQERLDSIQRTLDRIERQLEKGAPR